MVIRYWCLSPVTRIHLLWRRRYRQGAGAFGSIGRGVDFFNELERAIRESYPKPKMMILLPSNLRPVRVELEFFEKRSLWLNVMMCW